MFNGMLNNNALMNNFFRKVDNAVWDLQTGRLGFVCQDGIHTLSGEGEDAQVELNIIQQFGMPIPAFARSTPVASVKLGDMIHGNVKGWVVGIKTDAEGNVSNFKIMKTSGETTTWKPPQIKMLGLDSGVMVVTSLLNLAPGGHGGLLNLQQSLLPLMMLGGNVNIDSLMPLLLIQGGFGTSQDASSTNGLGGLVQNFMMMSMMQGMLGGNKSGGSGVLGGLMGNLGLTGNIGLGQSANPFGGRRGD